MNTIKRAGSVFMVLLALGMLAITAHPQSAAAQPIIRVYKNYNAWSNRDHSTLVAIGKVLGTDWFIHSMSALQNPIPPGTDVVLITSASSGDYLNQITQERDPAAQANLESFVRAGGVLILVWFHTL
jgi:hypothetical protein